MDESVTGILRPYRRGKTVMILRGVVTCAISGWALLEPDTALQTLLHCDPARTKDDLLHSVTALCAMLMLSSGIFAIHTAIRGSAETKQVITTLGMCLSGAVAMSGGCGTQRAFLKVESREVCGKELDTR